MVYPAPSLGLVDVRGMKDLHPYFSDIGSNSETDGVVVRLVHIRRTDGLAEVGNYLAYSDQVENKLVEGYG